MPSKSKKQQRLMGMAYAAKKGELDKSKLSPEVLKIMNSMSKSQIRDFAKTKSSNLPETSKKEASENEKEDKDCCTSTKDELKEKLKLIVEKNGISKIRGGNTRALNLKQYKLKKKAYSNISIKGNENLYKFAAWDWDDIKAGARKAWNAAKGLAKDAYKSYEKWRYSLPAPKNITTSNSQLQSSDQLDGNNFYRTQFKPYLNQIKPGMGVLVNQPGSNRFQSALNEIGEYTKNIPASKIEQKQSVNPTTNTQNPTESYPDNHTDLAYFNAQNTNPNNNPVKPIDGRQAIVNEWRTNRLAAMQRADQIYAALKKNPNDQALQKELHNRVLPYLTDTYTANMRKRYNSYKAKS